MNKLTLRSIALKILTRVREADYNSVDSTPESKIKGAIEVFLTIFELNASLLPQQVKIVDIVKGKLSTGRENILSFSSRKSDCCSDDDEFDYDFDILSLNIVRVGEQEYVANTAQEEGLYPQTYNFYINDDRQILRIPIFTGKLMLFGRFKEFDYCNLKNIEHSIALEYRFLEPLMAICAYEYAKRYLKKADIEFLKTFADEGKNDLLQNRISR